MTANSSKIKYLLKHKGLGEKSLKDFCPPSHVYKGLQFEVITGSVAYGVSDDTSDIDIYGFSIPPKETVFPHLAGEIIGFGRHKKRFEQWQQHHIELHEKSYDFQIFNIVKYFSLAMENNPNILDSLFVPERCVLFATPIAEHVRENRKLFLHKGSWHKFKGYAYSQLHKLKNKSPNGKRALSVEKYGYDVKFAYHIVRLIAQVEQILTEGDMDITRDRERLKAIRRGEWKEERIYSFFYEKEKDLEKIYNTSKLRYSPDESAIKNLLLECLEQYYGSLSAIEIRVPGKMEEALRQIESITKRVLK